MAFCDLALLGLPKFVSPCSPPSDGDSPGKPDKLARPLECALTYVASVPLSLAFPKPGAPTHLWNPSWILF